jgi:glycosyltransferase involved in cell wall biosynthesis
VTSGPDNPVISIIMPSYNHERFIGAAVASILTQTFQNFELIIVDDSSADGSAKIISGFSDPRIRANILDANRGACEAMNVALHMSRGKYIAVCNSDDTWRADKLSRQLEFLEKNDGIGAACTASGMMARRSPLSGWRFPGMFSNSRIGLAGAGYAISSRRETACAIHRSS